MKIVIAILLFSTAMTKSTVGKAFVHKILLDPKKPSTVNTLFMDQLFVMADAVNHHNNRKNFTEEVLEEVRTLYNSDKDHYSQFEK